MTTRDLGARVLGLVAAAALATTLSTASAQAAAPSPSPRPGSASPASPRPLGPGGRWALRLHDAFSGTTIDQNHWDPAAWGSGVSLNNSSQSGGALHVWTHADGTQAVVASQASWDGGTDAMAVGRFLQTRVRFPANPDGTCPAEAWPTVWTTGQNWPANGELDLAEGASPTLSAGNYHYGPAGTAGQSDPGPHPPGHWCGQWHTYGLLRGPTDDKVYWDGHLVRDVATHDAGGPQRIVLSIGPVPGQPHRDVEMDVDDVAVYTPA